MDLLTAFGLLAVGFTMVCYVLEERGRGWVLGFAGGCLASSAYGFLQGAWPFGVVELVWTGVALRRWWRGARGAGRGGRAGLTAHARPVLLVPRGGLEALTAPAAALNCALPRQTGSRRRPGDRRYRAFGTNASRWGRAAMPFPWS